MKTGLLVLALMVTGSTTTLAGQEECGGTGTPCGWTRLLIADTFGKSPAIRDLAVDAAGNTLLAGDTYPVTEPAGKSVGLIVKYDISGNVAWIKYLATSHGSFTTANSISVDANGGFCLGGTTDGVFGKQRNSGAEGFVASYRADGSRLWAKEIREAVLKVAVDDKGNCLATTLNEVIKLTEDGSIAWRREIAGGTLAVGPKGMVYVTTPAGDGTVPSIAVLNSAGKESSRLRPTLGGSLATREFDLRNRMLAVDRQGNLYLQATLTLVTGGGRQTVAAYLAKLDATGKLMWERYHTSNGFRWDSFDIGLDAADNAFLTGRLISMKNPSHIDAFVLGFDAAGNVNLEKTFGTPEFDGAGSIAIDSQGNYHVAGGTEGALDGQYNNVKQWAVPYLKQGRTAARLK